MIKRFINSTVVNIKQYNNTNTLRQFGGKKKKTSSSSSGGKMLTSVPGHKCPFNESTIGGRQASNLFRVASREGILSQIGQDLSAIRSAYDESEKIRKIIQNPFMTTAQKQVADAFCDNQGSSQMFRNFLHLLVDQNRFAKIVFIDESQTRMVKRFTKEEVVKVTSAQELDAATKSEVLEAVKEGLDLEVLMSEFTVNPSIMGGLQVQVGDKQIDLSLEQKYKNIKSELNSLLK